MIDIAARNCSGFMYTMAPDFQYSIAGDVPFRLQQNSSVILSNEMFDYETRQADFYYFTVYVRDGSSDTSCGTFAVVIIAVLDANDNLPVFSQDVYYTSLPESFPSGYGVFYVVATDLDSGTNGEVSYSSTRNDTFDVNSDGYVTVVDRLSFSTQPVHSITITAVDGGFPPNNATCTLNITIIRTALLSFH